MKPKEWPRVQAALAHHRLCRLPYCPNVGLCASDPILRSGMSRGRGPGATHLSYRPPASRGRAGESTPCLSKWTDRKTTEHDGASGLCAFLPAAHRNHSYAAPAALTQLEALCHPGQRETALGSLAVGPAADACHGALRQLGDGQLCFGSAGTEIVRRGPAAG